MILVGGYELDEHVANEFIEMRNDQNPREFLRYIDVATESINNPQTRVALVQKLYEDLLKHAEGMDFEPIPLTKGDFTRYKHFDTMTKTIEKLDTLFAGASCKEFEMTQKLYNMLIACRSDFEYGFKFEVELIRNAYMTLVVALHRMIDISTVKYFDLVKQKSGVKYLPSSTVSEELLIVQSVKGILKSYDKGEWTTMVNSFKKGRNNWFGAIGAAANAAGVIAGGAVAGPVGVAVTVVISLLGIVMLLRKAIYVFYNSAYKIDEAVRRNKKFLEFTIANSLDQSTNAVVAQEKFLQVFNRIHDVIETKVFAENVKAKKRLKEANKARFSVADITPENFTTATLVTTPVAEVGTIVPEEPARPTVVREDAPVQPQDDTGTTFF